MEPASDMRDSFSDEKGPQSPDSKESKLRTGVTAVEVSQAAQDGVAAAFDSHGRALVKTDTKAEDKLRLKFDLHLMPFLMCLYLFTFIDRTNIGNAKIAGLEKDLKLVGYEYNTALSVFFVSYIVFEIPSNMICKAVGPRIWIPGLCFAFGVISLCTAFVTSYSGLLAARFFLGVCEAGVMPGIAYYLSRWYRRSELVFRLSLYIVTAPLAGAFGGLLASGLLDVPSIGTVKSWKKIFLVEGIITMGIALISMFFLPDSPQKARFLSEEEKMLAAVRTKSENPATTTSIDAIHNKSIRRGILNVNTLTIGLIFLVNNITVQGVAIFFPTLTSSLYPHQGLIRRQLLTVPPYVVGGASVLTAGFLSWKMNRRAIHMIWTSLVMIVGTAMYLGSHNPHVRYGGTFLLMAGAYPFGALCNGWGSPNLSPDTSRAAGIGTIVMMGNTGGLISTWTFLPQYAPDYKPGVGLMIATAAVEAMLAAGLWAYQVRENRLRDQGGRDYRLDGLTPDEIALLGHKHPAFRYSH